MTDYERIVVLANDAFITLYGPRILVYKNALSRPDIIELNKQTKRMCLSLDCHYIVSEETEVNLATSKKKITKHTDKLPIVGKIGVNDVSYVYQLADDSNNGSANISQTGHFLHGYPPSFFNAIANNKSLIHQLFIIALKPQSFVNSNPPFFRSSLGYLSFCFFVIKPRLSSDVPVFVAAQMSEESIHWVESKQLIGSNIEASAKVKLEMELQSLEEILYGIDETTKDMNMQYISQLHKLCEI
ncbi:hypothetical protein RFI_36901 [Reticulomyxa filosa]|uniref:Uncharacterized protein n=1 Tax=Reticulomyxa filosa TaxID=46433 RepID=X6LG42_RETFI|nr:hypothetical protein RFI_36901 [Reticulomyxa filosa]|eukprot:ETO00539.1 hypothetical protein RFI_36901 [Reticulomyxa filosa]